MAWISLGPDVAEILAVHAANVPPFGHILYFGGDQHDEIKANKKDFADSTRLFDTATLTINPAPSPHFDAFCSGHSLLAGPAGQLPDLHGALFVAGGTSDLFSLSPQPNKPDPYHVMHFPGIRDCALFDPPKAGWKTMALMNTGILRQGEPPANIEFTGGRWYPTLVTLENGHVFVMEGHPGNSDGAHSNYIPEIFNPYAGPTGTWTRLGSFTKPADTNFYQRHEPGFYPRLHLLPSGDIFISNPMGIDPTGTFTFDWRRTTFHRVCNTNYWPFLSPEERRLSSDDEMNHEIGFGIQKGYSGTSVLLPLSYVDDFEAHILALGNSIPLLLHLGKWSPANHLARVIIPELPDPTIAGWATTGPRAGGAKTRRLNLNAVILPTGEVLVCGGINGRGPTQTDTGGWAFEQLDDPWSPLAPGAPGNRAPEIYNPVRRQVGAQVERYNSSIQDEWRTDGACAVVRNYHSVALLMPDGRVWTAGSDRNANRGIQWAVKEIEIYSPWYYGNPDRPFLAAYPDKFVAGETVIVRSTSTAANPKANEIVRVALLRFGSCTHAFNSDQRYIDMKFTYAGDDILQVEIPKNTAARPSVLVPGYYFLFTINSQSLPSHGGVIYVHVPVEHE